MQPLVSVIITTYARPDNLLRAIDSVLKQTYPKIEIIVVDDNGLGTNYQVETASLLKNYIESGDILYIPHEKNLNASAARNTGFLYSKGAFVNFFDDDDIMSSSKIEKQVSLLLEKEESFGACSCDMKIVNKHRTFYTNNKREGNVMVELLTGKYNFNTSTMIFRRKVIDELKGWDTTFYRHQDFELCVRFFRKYKMAFVNEPFVVKYETNNVITKNPIKAIEYREYFLSKFNDDFEQSGKKREICLYLYSELCLILLKNGLKEEGLKILKKTLAFGIPTLYDIMKIGMYLLIK